MCWIEYDNKVFCWSNSFYQIYHAAISGRAFIFCLWICEKILIYICRLVSYITHPTAFFALCVGIRLAAGCAAVMISISVTCILLKSSVFNSSTVIVSVEFCISKFMLGKSVYMEHMGRFSSAKSYILNNKSYIPKSFIIILL